MVLRHRGADHGRNGSVCASTRSRSTGSTIRIPASAVLHTALDGPTGCGPPGRAAPESRQGGSSGPSILRPARMPSRPGGNASRRGLTDGRRRSVATGGHRDAPRRVDGVRDDREVFADELLRFAGVGAVSTVAYAGTFAALNPAWVPTWPTPWPSSPAAWGTRPPTGAWPDRPTADFDRRHRIATAAALTRSQPGLHHRCPGRHPRRGLDGHWCPNSVR